MSFISVIGAQEHNLKDVNVDIPKNSLVAFTGISGSGKSSLVFNTIYAEAFRRFVDASQAPIYVMGNSVWSKISRPKFRSITGLPPALGLSQRQGVASRMSTVGTLCGASDLLRVYYSAFGNVFCRKCDISLKATDFPTLVKEILSEFEKKKAYFISVIVEKRKGAFQKEIEKFRELGFSKLRVNGSLYDLQENKPIKIDGKKLNTVEVIVDYIGITTDKLSRIERAISQCLDYGHGVLKLEVDNKEYKYNTKSSCPQCGESAPKLDPRHFSHSSIGQCPTCSGLGTQNENLPCDLFPCHTCQGSRLTPNRPTVRVKGKTYEQLHSLPISELNTFFETHLPYSSLEQASETKVLSELRRLLNTIVRLNLGHLLLNRAGDSLSPGDLQRLRLSSMLSNHLNGALYVMDEPCQGLTREEVLQLVKVFQEMVQKKASVLAVEHHPTFLQECETVFVMGPKAGRNGGKIIEIMTKGMSEKNFKKKSKPKQEHSPNYLNFTDISVRKVKIPQIRLYQGKINLLRGPSGTGKSSFINLCVIPKLKELGGKLTQEDSEENNNNPAFFDNFCSLKTSGNLDISTLNYVKPGTMTRSSRKIVASSLEVLQPLRALYAQLPTSQVMGLSESSYSWNSKLGRCDHCEGKGYIELPQKYSQPVRMPCEVCLGAKLQSRVLIPRFKGYHFAELMNLTLEQAHELLLNQKQISQRLGRAINFGLGYVLLGQGMDSLSGGELQRLTLTLQLKRANLTGAWFLLFHPGTGLHEPDIEILGKLMQEMTDKGATFILVENREEFLPFSTNIISFS